MNKYIASTVTIASLVTSVMAFDQVGPTANPDDQWRFIWDCSDTVVPDLSKRGFNMIINYQNCGWDIVKDKGPKDMEARAQQYRKRLDFYQTNNVDFVQRFSYGWDAGAKANYPRLDKNGKKIEGKEGVIDSLVPEYLASVRHAVAAQTRLVSDHPALVGTLTESETRGFVQPSFTDLMKSMWRQHSGCEVPVELTNGRNPIPWSKRKNFPADHIVSDNDPLLEFYRWQWRVGDGWTGYLDIVAETFAANCPKPVLTMYDPTLRTLSQWGCIGPKVSHLNHWTYVYPEPYRIGYNIAELQCVARGTPGQKVLAMIQAISYRSVNAPKGEHPANEPKWALEMTNCNYITTAPDLVQEAMWHVFARKVDGVGFHGWNALYDDGKRATTKSYGLSNSETINRIERMFREVGIPLGPLVKAIPEREPVVAVLESCASQVLSSQISYGVHNYFSEAMFLTDAANLSPYVIYEDEIRTRGIPNTVKVLILPKCSVLPRSVFERVRDFQREGGRLVADDKLLPALKADATYVSFEAEARNMMGDFDDGIVRKATDAEVRDRGVWSAAAKLKAAVGIEPYVDSTEPHILVHARTYGEADYVFAINSKRKLGDYLGAWRRVLEHGLPNSGKVIVHRKAGAVYDLVRHTAVPFEVKDGVTEISVSYDTNDGRAFMVVDDELSQLSYHLDGTRLTVTSPDSDMMIPICVGGFGDKPFYAIVKDGSWSYDFGTRPQGLSVRNLADGQLASAE